MLPKYKIDSSSPDGKKLESVSGEIEFRDVSFRYPARREAEVFNGFSLKVEPGKTVALVGASGCVSFELCGNCVWENGSFTTDVPFVSQGKSTAVQLIERFYDPDSGSITLDESPAPVLHFRRRHPWRPSHLICGS